MRVRRPYDATTRVVQCGNNLVKTNTTDAACTQNRVSIFCLPPAFSINVFIIRQSSMRVQVGGFLFFTSFTFASLTATAGARAGAESAGTLAPCSCNHTHVQRQLDLVACPPTTTLLSLLSLSLSRLIHPDIQIRSAYQGSRLKGHLAHALLGIELDVRVGGTRLVGVQLRKKCHTSVYHTS